MSKGLTKQHLNTIIGQNIRFERSIRNIFQKDLAAMLGLAIPHMSHIERGVRGATAFTLLQVAGIFGIPVDNLFMPRDVDEHSSTRDYEEAAREKRRKIRNLISVRNNAELDTIIDTIEKLIAKNYVHAAKTENVSL